MSRPTRSEITPEPLVYSRRRFLRKAGLAAATIALASSSLTACDDDEQPVRPTETLGPAPTPTVEDLEDALTLESDVNSYNNYYEFTVSKSNVKGLAEGFEVEPWTIEIGGLVGRPGPISVQEILARYEQEERIERMRCVEGWSMVIPWIGFPLARLLEDVEPTPEAQYVRFEALYDPDRMPGQRTDYYDWPYVEGLRLDEARHDLAILATGLYNKPLTPQMGAPIRLVVPWKYGFKSIKAIVKIDLVAEMPTTFWMRAAPSEYGFYANVNPRVDHPRWSQATERRIGERGRRETLMFNGYDDEVASLYEGMDLRVNF